MYEKSNHIFSEKLLFNLLNTDIHHSIINMINIYADTYRCLNVKYTLKLYTLN